MVSDSAISQLCRDFLSRAAVRQNAWIACGIASGAWYRIVTAVKRPNSEPNSTEQLLSQATEAVAQPISAGRGRARWNLQRRATANEDALKARAPGNVLKEPFKTPSIATCAGCEPRRVREILRRMREDCRTGVTRALEGVERVGHFPSAQGADLEVAPSSVEP